MEISCSTKKMSRVPSCPIGNLRCNPMMMPKCPCEVAELRKSQKRSSWKLENRLSLVSCHANMWIPASWNCFSNDSCRAGPIVHAAASNPAGPWGGFSDRTLQVAILRSSLAVACCMGRSSATTQWEMSESSGSVCGPAGKTIALPSHFTSCRKRNQLHSAASTKLSESHNPTRIEDHAMDVRWQLDKLSNPQVHFRVHLDVLAHVDAWAES